MYLYFCEWCYFYRKLHESSSYQKSMDDENRPANEYEDSPHWKEQSVQNN